MSFTHDLSRTRVATGTFGILAFAVLIAPAVHCAHGGAKMLLAGSGYLRPRVLLGGSAVAYLTYDPEGERLSLVRRSILPSDSTPEVVISNEVEERSDVSLRLRDGAIAFILKSDNRSSVAIVARDGKRLIPLDSSVESPSGGLAWLSDGKHLAVGVGNSIQIYDTISRQQVARIDIAKLGLSPDLTVIAVSPEDRLAFSATAPGDPEEDASRIWVLDAWQPLPTPRAITKGRGDHSPEWVNSKKLVFSRVDHSQTWKRGSATYSAQHLWIVSISTGKERPITKGLVADDHPSYLKSENTIVFARIPFTEIGTSETSGSRANADKPFSALLEGIKEEILFMAFNSRIASIPLTDCSGPRAPRVKAR